MPANFLHGVETIEIEKGARPIRAVKTAVIGLVGTAPIQDVESDYRTVNRPVLILNDRDAAKYFGTQKTGYTIPQALDAIFDQGSGIVIVVNVFNPDVHKNAQNEPDPSQVTVSDIIGGTDASGNRTGMQAFKDCYNLFGFFPKILIAPVYCTQVSVATELNVMAGAIRAVAIVDAPAGTTFQQAIAGRGPNGSINFNFSSERMILCYPHLKVYDPATDTERLEPYSQRLAGVIAAKDIEKGYWWSPSNTEIKGITGVERNLSAMINDPNSEVNLLNEAGIVTVFNSFGTGLRTWGNRSAAWPSVTHPKNFINVRRTADVLHESIEYSMLQFIDFPINDALIDAICESVNMFIRTLIARGALIDGRCWFDKAKNPYTEIALGHLTFDIEFMPPTPAERITFESFINIELLKKLGGSQ
ncbi:phage tail sheath subtilisin-like domain-containing protein [Thermodesulfovibrio sp. 1176]|uniref:phage tail sheath subtilisin-like domain-containing protein n=3 Tax=unclassified Thermodesulfovibrio TaxID=2645936 RepID=UPI00248319F9|nr:phage tail sheath subtilisin-like domain-containing protein [Thermodesulfovibrio sp. 1176]MDI1471928.1 phage tail sheath subtilisin-like domain-containing protein [Thermodesulfovibrio sp. 1176]